MIGIDTNVLVRYFTKDDETQSKLAANTIQCYIGAEKSILINNIVICELIWVLLRGYKYKKPDLIALMKQMIATTEFAFEDHNLFFISILEYEETDADFSDIMIGNLNKQVGCNETITFDHQASLSPLFKLLK